MKYWVLVSGALLMSSLSALGQWSINEEATNIPNKYNCVSVKMVGDDVHVGSVCYPHVDSIDFEMYSYGASNNLWETSHTVSQTSSYMYMRNLKFLNNSTGFATLTQIKGYGGSGTRHTIIKTTDGGITWSKKFQTPTFISGFAGVHGLDFFDNNHGIAVGIMPLNDDLFGDDPSARIWTTQDGGENWAKVTLPTSMDYKGIFGIDILNDTTAFVIMRDVDVNIPHSAKKFYVYKTSDRGQTWSQLYADLFPLEYAPTTVAYNLEVPDIDFTSENNGWIIFNTSLLQSYIYKTTDGGTSWTEVDHPIKESNGLQDIDFQEVHFINDDEGFIVGGNHCTDQGCFRGSSLIYTSNGGLDWDVIRYEPNGPSLIAMDYDPLSKIGYAVGGTISSTNGAIFKFENPSLNLEEVNNEIDEFIVYPNPSSGTVVMVANSTKNAFLRVIQLDGKLVKEKVIIGGEAQVDLESGVYFFQYGTQTKKVIIN